MTARAALEHRELGAASRNVSRIKYALAAIAAVYCLLRLGPATGAEATAAALCYGGLEWGQSRTRLPALRALVLCLQTLFVAGAFLAPAPFGFGSVMSTPLAVQSPLLLVLLCQIAASTTPPRPLTAAVVAATALFGWAAVRPIALAMPGIQTQANLVLSHFKNGIELLETVSGPRYFNAGLWRGDLTLLGITAFTIVFASFRVHRLARRTADEQGARDALSAYFSPQVIDVILENRAETLAPRERDIAVLDCDLVGFTHLAESLPPESVARTLRLYRALTEGAILDVDGAVISHEGDGIRAAFGLVDDGATACERACAAARKIVAQWPAQAASLGFVSLPKLAIGIEYGPTRIGLIGRGRTLTLLMLGEPVARAAELQRATRDAGTPILVGPSAQAVLDRSAS